MLTAALIMFRDIIETDRNGGVSRNSCDPQGLSGPFPLN
jgi:hypothetical protein